MDRMTSVTCDGSRLEQLKTLAYVLARRIDDDSESHSMAQLARQYRETIREIAELEAENDGDDIISKLISEGDIAG